MLETPSQILEHDASKDAVRGFIEWRKLIKKPLTDRAAAMVGKTLREITANGGDADEALDLAAERGWQTIKSSWYWNDKVQNTQPLKVLNGGRNGQPDQHSQAKRRDPALEQMLRLSGAGAAPGAGGR